MKIVRSNVWITSWDSFDLKEMVDGATHESGHTLDVLITPTLDNLIISLSKRQHIIYVRPLVCTVQN